MAYIHELPEWPNFRWECERLAGPLAEVRYKQGLLLGAMRSLGFDARQEADLEVLTSDVVKSSAIEGEVFDYAQVRSSIARNLGIPDESSSIHDRNIDGIALMTIDATKNYAEPLTEERLFGWHASLFPTGRSGLRKIAAGRWRDVSSDPMQVVSGSGLRERVHFEAPAAGRVPHEMSAFFKWFEKISETDMLIHAAISHLYFVTIHPFEDGNGRIARAIADMCLARAEDEPCRFYSVSSAIERDRASYYRTLESAQKGSLDVTGWLIWFISCIGRAIDASEDIREKVLLRSRVFSALTARRSNDRQRLVLARMLKDFKGNLTSSKYAKIARCSQDTALRDIRELLDIGILERTEGGGRSAAYRISPNK